MQAINNKNRDSLSILITAQMIIPLQQLIRNIFVYLWYPQLFSAFDRELLPFILGIKRSIEMMKMIFTHNEYRRMLMILIIKACRIGDVFRENAPILR